MADFAPINDDHAITSVIFTLALDEFIEPPVLSAAVASAPWRDTLPAFTRLPDAQISTVGQTFDTPALQCGILRPDGRPIWALRFNGMELSVECTSYTRWNSVWKQASEYLTQAWDLIRLHQPNILVNEYRLTVSDVFTTDADVYQLSDLFIENAPMLPPKLSGDVTIWHTNFGWVEIGSGGRIFETVQAQSVGQRDGYAAKGPYKVTLTHALRTSVDQTPHDGMAQADAIINELHSRNKRLLLRNLKPVILDRIGLK